MTEAQLLDGDAFNRLVLEQGLEGKTWEQNGYVYAGFRGKDGYELYRAYGPKWKFLWVFTQLCTQDNVAGGNLVCRVTMPAGMTGTLNCGSMLASGNRAAFIALYDNAIGAYVYINNVAAVAAAKCTYPQAGGAGTTSNGPINSIGLLVGASQVLQHQVTSAAQTETATVYVSMILSANQQPTVSWAASAGTPNVSAATVNTITPVLVAWP